MYNLFNKFLSDISALLLHTCVQLRQLLKQPKVFYSVSVRLTFPQIVYIPHRSSTTDEGSTMCPFVSKISVQLVFLELCTDLVEQTIHLLRNL